MAGKQGISIIDPRGDQFYTPDSSFIKIGMARITSRAFPMFVILCIAGLAYSKPAAAFTVEADIGTVNYSNRISINTDADADTIKGALKNIDIVMRYLQSRDGGLYNLIGIEEGTEKLKGKIPFVDAGLRATYLQTCEKYDTLSKRLCLPKMYFR